MTRRKVTVPWQKELPFATDPDYEEIVHEVYTETRNGARGRLSRVRDFIKERKGHWDRKTQQWVWDKDSKPVKHTRYEYAKAWVLYTLWTKGPHFELLTRAGLERAAIHLMREGEGLILNDVFWKLRGVIGNPKSTWFYDEELGEHRYATLEEHAEIDAYNREWFRRNDWIMHTFGGKYWEGLPLNKEYDPDEYEILIVKKNKETTIDDI
jgi:hypothetical protein